MPAAVRTNPVASAVTSIAAVSSRTAVAGGSRRPSRAADAPSRTLASSGRVIATITAGTPGPSGHPSAAPSEAPRPPGSGRPRSGRARRPGPPRSPAAATSAAPSPTHPSPPGRPAPRRRSPARQARGSARLSRAVGSARSARWCRPARRRARPAPRRRSTAARPHPGRRAPPARVRPADVHRPCRPPPQLLRLTVVSTTAVGRTSVPRPASPTEHPHAPRHHQRRGAERPGPAQPALRPRHARGVPGALRRDRAAGRVLPARGLAAVHRRAAVRHRPPAPLHLSLPTVLVAAAAGALAGAQTGFWIGRRVGPPLLDRPDRPRLHAGVTRARAALDRYGNAKAIVLARFIPVVRTVLNPLAGAVGVPVRTFTVWQVAGGLLWSLGLTLAGYALGSRIPNVDRYLLPIVAVIVVASLIPVALELLRGRARSR